MLIIDIGAHDGSSFSIPYAKDRNNLVYAIEPIPALANKIRSSGLPNLYVFCTAIGEEEGLATFYLNQDSQTSSLLPNSAEDGWSSYADSLKTIETIEVPVLRLDNFMRSHHIVEVDLLKVDAQGYDLQVIKSAGDLIRKVRRIQLEVQVTPLYKGSASKDEILEYLEASGFRLVSTKFQTEGLEENLEFVRLYHYLKVSGSSSNFEVNLPYVGPVQTPQNDLVGKLLQENLFEGPEQAFLWLYLRSGDTFFDCGAHVGVFSCIAAKKLEDNGKIIGFEPVESNINFYRKNLESLGCRCFEAIQAGLSDQAGSATLFLGKSGFSAYSTFATGVQIHEQIGEDSILVDQVTLDQVVEEYSISKVALAKLDVEGWEIPVLLGARQSIARGVFPLWMIEFTEENAVAAGTSTRELVEVIESLGYTLCRFDATEFKLVPETKRLSYGYENLFAVFDLAAINHRLSTSSTYNQSIAKDIIQRSDLALRSQEFYDLLSLSRTLLNESELDRAARLEQIFTLTEQLKESNLDRVARFEQIQNLTKLLERLQENPTALLDQLHQLTQKLQESEQDRTARLSHIHELTQRLQESEQHSLSRLEQIHELTQRLQESERHSLSRLEQIHELTQRLQDSEQDRIARLDQIETLTQWLQEAKAKKANKRFKW
jgi:FkbM family methyltransferase